MKLPHMNPLYDESEIVTVDDKWATASFRVFSDTLTPAEMAAALGIQPEGSYKIADRVSQRAVSTAVRNTNAIFLRSGLTKDKPIEEHLIALLKKIEGKTEALRSISDKVTADLFCGFSSSNCQGGFTLTPALLSRLAALGLEVGFDLYPPSSDAGGE